MLLGDMLRETRNRHPEKICLWFGDRSWTYAKFDDATDRIAAALAEDGVAPGDRVALFLPNCPELLLAYFACFKLGAISVPLNYRYKQPEARYALEHSGSTVLIAHPALVSEVESLPLTDMGVRRCYLTSGVIPRPGFTSFDDLLTGPANVPATTFNENQPAAILYTSGSTAKPKGVTYSHASLWNNCKVQAASMEFTPDEVHLITTAACHAAALTGQWLPTIFIGGTAVLTHLPTPAEVVRAAQAHGVTWMQMLPAGLEDLVEYLEQAPAIRLEKMRCFTAGGDVVPIELHHRFHKVFGFHVTEVCGMTELLTYLLNPPFGDKRLGSVGKPAADTKVRLSDGNGSDVPTGETGEILAQSPAMMVGYWNDPAATAETLRDGWMHTGDLARQDADGYFWFVGRKKEIIIRAGSNISPLEVEEVLDDHPAVHLSCVVGVPDKHYGEIVAAYVALRADVEPKPTAQELRQFAAARLAAYKVPERITLVDELPLNSTGKVDRRKLHARVLRERSPSASSY